MIHKCNLCGYQTPYKANLNRHVKNKHAQNHTGSEVIQNVHQTNGQNEYQSRDVDACIRQWQEAYKIYLTYL